MRRSIFCSLMGSVVLWERVESGRLLSGVLNKGKEVIEGKGEMSQFSELKAIQLDLDIVD